MQMPKEILVRFYGILHHTAWGKTPRLSGPYCHYCSMRGQWLMCHSFPIISLIHEWNNAHRMTWQFFTTHLGFELLSTTAKLAEHDAMLLQIVFFSFCSSRMSVSTWEEGLVSLAVLTYTSVLLLIFPAAYASVHSILLLFFTLVFTRDLGRKAWYISTVHFQQIMKHWNEINTICVWL